MSLEIMVLKALWKLCSIIQMEVLLFLLLSVYTNSTPRVVTAGDRALLSPLCSVTGWLSSCLWVVDGAAGRNQSRVSPLKSLGRFSEPIRQSCGSSLEKGEGLENLSGSFWVHNSSHSQERLHLERGT